MLETLESHSAGRACPARCSWTTVLPAGRQPGSALHGRPVPSPTKCWDVPRAPGSVRENYDIIIVPHVSGTACTLPRGLAWLPARGLGWRRGEAKPRVALEGGLWVAPQRRAGSVCSESGNADSALERLPMRKRTLHSPFKKAQAPAFRGPEMVVL